MNVLRSLTFSVAFYANLLPPAVFKKLTIFLWKTNLFFQKGANFSTFWEIGLIQLQPNTNFPPLAVFKKNTIFFRKTHLFHLIKTSFEGFEKSYFFSRILRRNCFFWRFWKKKQESFGKTHLFFFQTKANFWKFWEILLIHSHSGVSLLPVAILKFFFENPSVFWRKARIFPCFEKTYLYIRILQQNC